MFDIFIYIHIKREDMVSNAGYANFTWSSLKPKSEILLTFKATVGNVKRTKLWFKKTVLVAY